MQNLAQFQQDLYKRPNHARIQQSESSRNSGEVLFPIFTAAAHEQLGFPLQSSFLTLPKDCWQTFFYMKESIIKHLWMAELSEL